MEAIILQAEPPRKEIDESDRHMAPACGLAPDRR